MLRPRLLPVLALGFLLASARADFDPANFDTTVKPQDDFYHYVNGGWIKKTQIPADHARWAVFDILAETNLDNSRTLCERATAQNDQSSQAEQKVADFYASGMDAGGIAGYGAQPLQFEFERIDALKTPADILSELAHLNGLGVQAGFVFDSTPDLHQSDMNIAEVRQAGLGLPDRDYYFRTDDRSKELREQYVAHVKHMLEMVGEPAETSADAAAAVMRLETALAGASLTDVQLRDPAASYHKINLSEAAALFPGIDWRNYFSKTEAPKFTSFNLAHPNFLREVGELLTHTPLREWQSYLRWQFIHTYAPFLSDGFVNAHFDFYGKTLTGAKRLRPRWERVVMSIDNGLGEALGQLYVANYFPPEARARALQLVSDVRAALRARIQTLEWMDEPTKAKALEKLDAMKVKIGYPDKWRDYSALVIDRGPYVLNVLKSNAFEVRRQLKKIGQPVDPGEWDMTPATVNAYYSPERNEIVFPAGILQPPFFNPQSDDACNYGAIGQVIGHEMTHGFDDQGRQYDAHGNLTDWWSPESAARFKTRAAAIVKQFNAYHVFPDLTINGELTQGENIADLGGLKLAYSALETRLGDAPRAPIGGFTPEQRFFLSFAADYAVRYRPEALRMQVLTNPHSPGEFRCNGPVSNLPEFADAFHVPPGAPMRRPEADRVQIW